MVPRGFPWIRRLGLPGLAVGMFVFSVYHLLFAVERHSLTSPRLDPPRAEYVRRISASGLVEAREENIAIGTAISGIVTDVYVQADTDAATVSKGTPLFRVDDRHFRSQLEIEKAKLATAQAQLARLQQLPRQEEIPVSEAKTRAAAAAKRQAEDEYERGKLLLERHAISEADEIARELEWARADQEWQHAHSEEQLLKAGAWKPDLSIAEANIQAARSQVAHLETELDRCIVRAPCDSRVLKVNMRPGEHVSASSGEPLMVLGDLSRLNVRTQIDEQDLARFDSQLPAVGLPRGNSLLEVPLKLVRVEPFVVPKKAFTGNNTERIDTRVLEVIYELGPSDREFYVGQQFDIFIEACE